MFAIGLANLMQPHSKRKIDANNWLPEAFKITQEEKDEGKKAKKKKHIPGQATAQLQSFLDRKRGGSNSPSTVDSVLNAVIAKGKEQNAK